MREIDKSMLEEVSFEDIETVEEIVTGATSGFTGCCIDIG